MQATMKGLAEWFEANGLNPADFRVRIEAKTITAQRDLMQRFAREVEPSLTPAAASHLSPTLEGVELRIDGPLPSFR